jgi:sec-independent protein translocase protein TatA
MFGIGMPELVLIMLLALLVLGPQRLPEVARTLGRAYAQLRRASDEFQRTIRQDIATLERQEDANRNKAVADELRERLAPFEGLQTSIKEPDKEPDVHG